MAFIRDNDEAAIDAFFGSRAKWEAIGDWSTFHPPRPDRIPSTLGHGYDEAKDIFRWGVSEYDDAADFRGGRLVSRQVTVGDIATPLNWRCAHGHSFTGSPRLVLRGGHWCPECVRDTAGIRNKPNTINFWLSSNEPTNAPTVTAQIASLPTNRNVLSE